VRILVTGSREWPSEDVIIDALRDAVMFRQRGEGHVLVHGAARGADMLAYRFARHATGWTAEAHPAMWNLYGPAAGPIRNQAMVDLGADLCLAFLFNNSTGTKDCISKAQYAGIPTAVYRMED
jgi:hypothetical protein